MIKNVKRIEIWIKKSENYELFRTNQEIKIEIKQYRGRKIGKQNTKQDLTKGKKDKD